MQRQPSGPRRPDRVSGRAGAPARAQARPAAARRPASPGAAKRTSAPRQGGMTGRATALLIVVAALALGYAYPVRIYLTQLAEIEAAQKSQEQQGQRIKDLELQADKWKDDDYVRAQARKRLFYVMPGETPLVPMFSDQVDTGSKSKPQTPQTWYGKLWASLDEANK